MPDYSILLEFAVFSYILWENEQSFYSMSMSVGQLANMYIPKKTRPNAHVCALGLVMYVYFACFGSHV